MVLVVQSVGLGKCTRTCSHHQYHTEQFHCPGNCSAPPIYAPAPSPPPPTWQPLVFLISLLFCMFRNVLWLESQVCSLFRWAFLTYPDAIKVPPGLFMAGELILLKCSVTARVWVPPTEEHVGGFRVLAIVNKAAVSTQVLGPGFCGVRGFQRNWVNTPERGSGSFVQFCGRSASHCCLT